MTFGNHYFGTLMPYREVGIHSIKAGGLLGEPLKVADKTVSRPCLLHAQFHLVVTLHLSL